MEPRPIRDNYLSENDYNFALQSWTTNQILREYNLTRVRWQPGQTVSPLDEDEEEEIDPTPEEAGLTKLMKQRHLNRDERRALHKPKPDWVEGKRGEVCRSACELDVSDLVTS